MSEKIIEVPGGEYLLIPIETGYIKPNENLDVIINPAKEYMKDG